jgi:LysM repeat protein
MKKCLGMFYSILVIIIFAGGLFGCSDEKVSKDVSSIKSRLEKIEDRLANIEKSAKKVGLLESEFQKLQQTMEAWERAITARLAPVSKKKTGSRTKAAATRKKKEGQRKTYVVIRGDSLFQIAQKHHMTVDQLCQLNKITTKTVVHPGDKLVVY